MNTMKKTYSEDKTLSSAEEAELVPAPLPLLPISGQEGSTHLEYDWMRGTSITDLTCIQVYLLFILHGMQE